MEPEQTQTITYFGGIGALVLALLHVVAGRLHRGAADRPRWLSAAAGISIAYVFIHLLPEVSEVQAEWLEARPSGAFSWLERQAYLMALLGLVVALGLQQTTMGQKPRRARFWLHTTSFAVYNFIIGGFGTRLQGLVPMLVAIVAFGAHFLVNDYSLHRQYGEGYERTARWLLALSILLGWGMQALLPLPAELVSALLALLAGSIILNTIKDELPEEREGPFVVFLGAVIAYSGLLLFLAYLQVAT